MFLCFMVPAEETGYDMVAPVQDGLIRHIFQFRVHDPDNQWETPNDVLIGILEFQENSNPVFSVLGTGFIQSETNPEETSLDFFLTVAHYTNQGGELEERARQYMKKYIDQIKKEFIPQEMEKNIAWSFLPAETTTPVLKGETTQASLH